MKQILLCALCLFSLGLFSQNGGSLKGRITDKTMNNGPLLMANVQTKGNEVIVQTNFHGNFEITDLAVGKHTLIISYLGYETIEIPIVIKENSITTLETGLGPLQFDFGDVAGMDVASKEEEIPTLTSTEHPLE